MLAAVLTLAAVFAAADEKGIKPPYTDTEAAAFSKRIDELQAEVNAGKRKPAADLETALAELKIDPKKVRGGPPRVGNATDWVDYPLSPSYTLVAAYTQQAPKATAFREVRIVKTKPAADR